MNSGVWGSPVDLEPEGPFTLTQTVIKTDQGVIDKKVIHKRVKIFEIGKHHLDSASCRTNKNIQDLRFCVEGTNVSRRWKEYFQNKVYAYVPGKSDPTRKLKLYTKFDGSLLIAEEDPDLKTVGGSKITVTTASALDHFHPLTGALTRQEFLEQGTKNHWVGNLASFSVHLKAEAAFEVVEIPVRDADGAHEATRSYTCLYICNVDAKAASKA